MGLGTIQQSCGRPSSAGVLKDNVSGASVSPASCTVAPRKPGTCSFNRGHKGAPYREWTFFRQRSCCHHSCVRFAPDYPECRAERRHLVRGEAGANLALFGAVLLQNPPIGAFAPEQESVALDVVLQPSAARCCGVLPSARQAITTDASRAVATVPPSCQRHLFPTLPPTLPPTRDAASTQPPRLAFLGDFAFPSPTRPIAPRRTPHALCSTVAPRPGARQ